MFAPHLTALSHSAKTLAHRTKWSAIGGVLCVIGLIFLSVAGWIAAEARFGALHTALGGGGLFLALGVIALLWSRRTPRSVAKAQAAQLEAEARQPELNVGSLVNAVVMGVAAGRALRKK